MFRNNKKRWINGPEGGADRLKAAEKARFLEEEWPQVLARMRQLDVDAGAMVREALPTALANSSTGEV